MVAWRLPRKLGVGDSKLSLSRDANGVIHVTAQDWLGALRGQGYAHAHDRLPQMLTTRLAGQGRLSECLDGGDEAFDVDVWLRRLGLARAAEAELGRCSPEALTAAEAYAQGVNAYLERHGGPLRLRMLGYQPEPWSPADTLLVIKVMSYVGLAQGQEEVERMLAQAIAHGVDPALLRALFHPWLDELDDAAVERLRGVHLHASALPAGIAFLPSLKASNNWVLSGRHTTSGAPLFAADPHLEVNRLPAIWVEHVLRVGDDYQLGATVPGMFGTTVGRTRHVAMGLTYGYMDMVDFFVEEVVGDRSVREGGHEPVSVREEVILRRGRPAERVYVHSTARGRLEVDPRWRRVPDGKYLAMAYSQLEYGGAETLEAMRRLPEVRSVEEAQATLRDVGLSANWLLADRAGNIGYQQSGVLPRRVGGGLVALSGADPANDWRGRVPGSALRSELNPGPGVLATANDELNPEGGPMAVNLCMGDYRKRRILQLLGSGGSVTKETCASVQRDLYSLQAEAWMALLRPLLPDSPLGRQLGAWDLCYPRDSQGATLFERVYDGVFDAVFAPVFGAQAFQAMRRETALLAFYYQYFDRVVLEADPMFFADRSRDQVFADVLARELAADAPLPAPLGEARRVRMTNILFGGKLPHVTRVDHGPVDIVGSRATVCQGGLLQTGGRLSSFAPSYRFITDLWEDRAETILAGGPSGRPGSRWYVSEVRRWLRFDTKTLAPW